MQVASSELTRRRLSSFRSLKISIYSLTDISITAPSVEEIFPAEAETLLPPLCMLQALRDGDAGGTDAGAFRMEDKQGTNSQGEVVKYKEIHVRPCFM